ncbi:MAG: PorT family protein [Bacteroidales bacterium]|nr:PorT family protein [Bacteroidales bacterium]
MKAFIKILIVLLSVSLTAEAQVDTLKDLPLFKNAVSVGMSDEGNSLVSQNTVADTVREKLQTLFELYSAGKYWEALEVSEDIHKNYHLSKKENLYYLKYTLAAHKDLENNHQADSLAKIYLQKDPFYSTDDSDPVTFREVLSNYYTKPKYSVWVAAGSFSVEPVFDTVRSIVDPKEKNPSYEITGFSAQIGFEFRPLKILSVSLSPTLSRYSIERTMERTDIATFHYYETSSVIALPFRIEAGWYFGREIFVPSIYAGAQVKYLLRSKYNAYTEARGSYTDIPDKQVDNDTKNRLNYSVLGGVRLNYNRRRITYFADIGASYDLKTYNDAKTKYSNGELLYQNLYVPDMFKMLEMYYRFGIKVNLQYKVIAKYGYGY